MVGLWPAVLLLLSLVKDAISWNMSLSPLDTVKRLCELTSFQDGWNFNSIDERILCELRFPYKVPEEEQIQHCEFMHPSYLIRYNSMVDNGTSCRYEITYLCPPGRFPVGHLCVEFQEEKKTFAEAEEECQKKRGQLPDAEYHGDVLLHHIINCKASPLFFCSDIPDLNPRKLGFSSSVYWLTGKEKRLLVTGRGLAQHRMGTILQPNNKTKAAHFCLHESMKTQRLYETECEIYRTQFKLAAHFVGGTCYMLSPSVSVQKKAAVLHERCQWFSPDDGAVSPLSTPRRDGIDGALAGTPYQYNYVTTTAEKDLMVGGDEQDGWAVVNRDSSSLPLPWGVWSNELNCATSKTCRPKKGDGKRDGFNNMQALTVPKTVREDALKNGAYFTDVPRFFRGHRVCATGATLNDMAFKECAQGWKPIRRDNGKIMCAKAFLGEIAGKSYDDAMAFCKTQGAVLTPMESPNEQALITKMVADLKPPPGSMWIGARRKPAGKSGKFFWELDGNQVDEGIGTNWSPGEPNNPNGIEDCIELYVELTPGKLGKWNDIECAAPGRAGRNAIHGGVCAKYHKQQ